MVTKTVKVINPCGIHLRPAGALAQTSMKFKCDVMIEYGDNLIDAKSVLNVMAAGIKCGQEIALICKGKDEEAALQAVVEAIEAGLGE